MATDYEGPDPATFFVRALYDYRSADSSSLTFHKGDLIEVLTQLDSGWWDGLLEDERGWFPSNYVVPVSEHEVEQEFRDNGYYQERLEIVPESMAPGQSSLINDPSWGSNENNMGASVATSTLSSFVPHSARAPSTESWIPKMSQSGHIYYLNPDTGEESSELPTMLEDHTEEDTTSREASMNNMFDSSRHADLSVMDGQAGPRGRTPDPWIRKMTDDGMAYYYWNPVNHEVRWTPPSPALGARERRDLVSQTYTNGTMRRGTASSAASDFAGLYADGPFYNGPLHDVPTLFAELGYGDSYNTNTDRRPLPSISSSSAYSGGRRPRAIRRLPDAPLVDHHTALEFAIDLQSAMEPEETSPSIQECSTSARESIQVVIDTATHVMDESPNTPRDGIDFIRERRLEGRFDNHDNQHPQLSGRVAIAASTVLDLLLASGKLLPPIQESDLNGEAPTQEYLKTVTSDPLTGFHRKVAANLSRLILSARAADSVPDARPPEMAATLERDARDLERSVVAFVLELDKKSGVSSSRRIRASLSSGHGVAGIGTGILGGGVGSSWKANGFVSPQDEETTCRTVPGADAIKDLNELGISVDDQLTKLSEVINMAYSHPYDTIVGSSTDPYLENGDPIVAESSFSEVPPSISREVTMQVVQQSQVVLAELSRFLHFAEDLDLASHLDFDGSPGPISVTAAPNALPDDYGSNVRQARHLVRAFEILKQSIYDQGSLLLLDAQRACSLRSTALVENFNESPFHGMLSASSTLKSGVIEVLETLESLVDIVTAQAGAALRSEQGHIGSRSPNHHQLAHSTSGDFAAVVGRNTSGNTFAGLIERDSESTIVNPIHPFSAAGGSESYRSRTHRRRSDIPATDNSASAATNTAIPSHPPAESPTLADDIMRNDSDWPPDDIAVPKNPDPSDPVVISKRERKLKNLLGADAPIAAQTTPTESEYMRRMYGPPDILLNSDLGVRGGTLPALVEHLTLHNRLDSTFNETFLMTFKSFATVDEVVTELITRFNLPPPPNLSPQQYAEWKDDKQKRYRFRTMNILKALIQSQTLDQNDLHVLDRIRDFAESIQESDMMAPKMQVLQTIKMRTDEAQAKKYTANGLQDPPPSILPKNLKKFKLHELDPVELARQLTIMESRLFNRVHAIECLERGKDKSTNTEDNIKAIIHMSNQMAAWVTDTVLAKDEVKKRAAVIRFWISVAEQCKRLKNFSTMAALVAGLNCPPIRRLRRSWEQVHQRANAVLADLEKTIDSGRNFAEYRRLLATIDLPCVPFFGLFLKDLTFIQDGNNNFIPVAGGKVINFDKRQKSSQVIREIRRYQAASYDLMPVEVIIEFIEQSLESVHQETDYWPISLEREPREREEERMARLLQESGFL
ncbi:ras GEF [Dacryopinax primogenitus]|uniref:Ras GEF n=1 Tax=Dacryopinax primogenitus (strain DJM 731) TaxID=1858805 RepID=M5G4S1_DACPD|nr:ras GEF [Dacryopinax primogenitus]EJU03215.1 ras GEF [Dacryopinax primogenitus]